MKNRSWIAQAMWWPIISALLVLVWLTLVGREVDSVTPRGVVALLVIALPIAVMHGIALGLIAVLAGKLALRAINRHRPRITYHPARVVFSVATAFVVGCAVAVYLLVIPASVDAPNKAIPVIVIGLIAAVAASLYGRSALSHVG